MEKVKEDHADVDWMSTGGRDPHLLLSKQVWC